MTSSLFDDLSPSALRPLLPQLGGPELGDATSDQPGNGAGAEPHSTAGEDLLTGLNPQQREAVVHQGGPLLIVAGAGSGKTRVLTQRIGYLLATGRARPSEILAITFTNKAAAEMRERVEELVGPRARYMAVSTFHSFCVRILPREAAALDVKSSFSIYDSLDSQDRKSTRLNSSHVA